MVKRILVKLGDDVMPILALKLKKGDAFMYNIRELRAEKDWFMWDSHALKKVHCYINGHWSEIKNGETLVAC